MFTKSVEHVKVPEKKGVVRGETVLSGYILEEDKGNVVMTLVNNSDPKGNIPGF